MSEHIASKRRAWIAVVLGLFMVGLGHAYAGKLRRGFAMFLTMWAVTLATFAVMLYLPAEHLCVWVGFALLVGFYLYTIIDAGMTARRSEASKLAPYQRWWIYIALFTGGYVANLLFAHTYRWVWAEAFVVPSGAMANTLIAGDRILADKRFYGQIRRGDVLVYRTPQDESVNFVFRVVGLPGETVEIRDERVYINGVSIEEPYLIIDETFPSGHLPPEVFDLAPKTIPPDHVFMMGDHRRRAYDSRITGPVPIANVVGRARVVYWSFAERVDPRFLPPGLPKPTDDIEIPGVRWRRIGLRLDYFRNRSK